jgi:hypothetical protein
MGLSEKTHETFIRSDPSQSSPPSSALTHRELHPAIGNLRPLKRAGYFEGQFPPNDENAVWLLLRVRSPEVAMPSNFSRYFAAIPLVILTLLTNSATVIAEPITIIDQSNVLPVPPQFSAGASAENFSTELLAQSFRVGIAGKLTAIDILLAGGGPPFRPTATLEIGIWSTVNSEFGTVPALEGQGVLGSVTFPFEAIPADVQLFHVDFSAQSISIQPGTDLAIVLRPQWMSVGIEGWTNDPYPFGGIHGRIEGSVPTCEPGEDRPCGWSNEQRFDAGFRTYVTTNNPEPLPEPGTLGLLAVGIAGGLAGSSHDGRCGDSTKRSES